MHRNVAPKFLRVLACFAVLTLGAPPVSANDLSTYPCTASDVEIIGSGVIVNEPCECPPGGTFDARVQFTVRNNTSSGRYCVALHLVPDGTVLTAPLDVVLTDIDGVSVAPGKQGRERYRETVMYGTIPNFPCNLGEVCFGESGVTRGKCAPGDCTTISWNTNTGAASCTEADPSPPGGQCRHQQICIVGFGVSLECTANCSVACGATSTLRACVTAPAERGPFTMTVAGDDGSSKAQSTLGDASGTTCLDFNVSPTKSPTTTYTLTVMDRDGCTRTATATVGVTPTVATITPPANPACNGVLQYTASVDGQTGCGFTWTIDGVSVATFAGGGAADDARVARVGGVNGSTLEFRALDNVCHAIAVSASCSLNGQTPCTATASTTVKQCVSPTFACP